jgi:hypothetical protein
MATSITDILHLDSTQYSGCKDYNERFSKLTDGLLNETVLVIGGQDYRLREVELYLYTDDHLDIYTHRDPDQGAPCRWYFHKTGSTYKGGTYKGLDITFGFKNLERATTYGGILIRGISNNDKLITGPCKVVDHILNINKFTKIDDLVRDLSENIKDVSKESKLYLKYDPNLIRRAIYCGPRVGLSFKYPDYAARNYRYLTYNIKEVEKYKPSIIMNLLNLGKTIEEVSKESECKTWQVKKYADLYNSGKERGDIQGLKPSATNMVILSGFVNK